MLEFKKILWPNDFSEANVQALGQVTSLIEKYGAEIHLLHVALDLSNYGQFWGQPDPKHVEGMHDFALRGAKKKLAEFCQHELSSCPYYEVHVALGDPAAQILKAITDTGADLVVLPVRGTGTRPALGSVASKVIESSPVPVLIVKPS